jgi:hypothetical protein
VASGARSLLHYFAILILWSFLQKDYPFKMGATDKRNPSGNGGNVNIEKDGVLKRAATESNKSK